MRAVIFSEFWSSIQTDLKRSTKKVKKKQQKTVSTKTKADLRIWNFSDLQLKSWQRAICTAVMSTKDRYWTTHTWSYAPVSFSFGLLHVKWDTPNLGFLKKPTCLPGSQVNCGPYWPGSRVNSGLIGPAAGWIAFALHVCVFHLHFILIREPIWSIFTIVKGIYWHLNVAKRTFGLPYPLGYNYAGSFRNKFAKFAFTCVSF